MAAALVAALLLTGAAVAGAQPSKSGAPAIRPLAATYAEDAFEAGAGDDTEDYATDVTGSFGPVGGTMTLQGHTISSAPIGSPNCDEDWFMFDVSASDYAAGTSYLIEADSRLTPYALRVIEVYGPGISNVSPSRPIITEEEGGWDYNLTLSGCIAPDQFTPWWHDDSGVFTVTFEPPSEGTYYFRVRPYRTETDDFGSKAGPYTLRLKKGFFSRAAGCDRVQTSVMVSQELYPPDALTNPGTDAWGESVVIANGWNYPDALAGSALAGQLSGPLLLTQPRYLPKALKNEIERLRPRYIYILGSGSSVSTDVANALDDLPTGAPATVTRIGGGGRAETAKLIAQKLYDDGGSEPIGPAFLVNGWNFADALSIAPLAALNHAPILLTHTGYLDAAAEQAIEDYGVTDVIIIGNGYAVSPAVEAQVNALVSPVGSTSRVRRVFGDNRYETSMKVALFSVGLMGNDGGDPWFVGTLGNPSALQALQPHQIGVASGQNFPDALSGGVWCGRAQAPLLLTPVNSLSPYIYSFADHTTPAGTSDYWYIVDDETRQGFKRGYVFGGSSSVSTPTYTLLDSVSGAAGY